jgi:hypothetical protein
MPTQSQLVAECSVQKSVRSENAHAHTGSQGPAKILEDIFGYFVILQHLDNTAKIRSDIGYFGIFRQITSSKIMNSAAGTVTWCW